MLTPQHAPIRIFAPERTLSKAQKTFNSQIEKLEKLRDELAAWEAAVVAYQSKYAQDLSPLLDEQSALQRTLALELDRCHGQKGLSSTDRAMLGEMVAELCANLLLDDDDAEIKALYNTYSHSDFDEEEALHLQDMKNMFEDVFGIELGDDPSLDSPEAVLRRAEEQMRQSQDEPQPARKKPRKKSAKQQAKEEQEQHDAQQISQSIREIYRKLMSALHPDREPDAEERERKTALVQRANLAYDQRNLLQLLELQLEVEHIDNKTVAQLDDTRLGHYNAVLKEQLEELRMERMRVEMDFRERFGIDFGVRVTPQTALRLLSKDIVLVQRNTRNIEGILRLIKAPGAVKHWLKSLRAEERAARRRGDFDDFSF